MKRIWDDVADAEKKKGSTQKHQAQQQQPARRLFLPTTS
jgi:hypothetical protein